MGVPVTFLLFWKLLEQIFGYDVFYSNESSIRLSRFVNDALTHVFIEVTAIMVCDDLSRDISVIIMNSTEVLMNSVYGTEVLDNFHSYVHQFRVHMNVISRNSG